MYIFIVKISLLIHWLTINMKTFLINNCHSTNNGRLNPSSMQTNLEFLSNQNISVACSFYRSLWKCGKSCINCSYFIAVILSSFDKTKSIANFCTHYKNVIYIVLWYRPIGYKFYIQTLDEVWKTLKEIMKVIWWPNEKNECIYITLNVKL